MNYNLYIDESGNTGNIELNNDMSWNFGNQPYFALGTYYIKQDCKEVIENKVIELLHEYDKSLGTEKELKSKANYKFKGELITKLTKLLLDNGAQFFFDISDKKYKIVMQIVEYCVYPYYLYSNQEYRSVKISAANFLYRSMIPEKLKYFIDLCQGDQSEEEIIKKVLCYLELLNEHFKEHKQSNESLITVTDFIKNNQSISTRNLIPIKDYNNKGTKESFVPNVDAFNSIVGIIGKLKLTNNDSISIYHDEQKQFSEVLLYWSKKLEDKDINIKSLEFCNSKDNIMIQIADFYTGVIVRLFRKIIESSYLERKDRDLIKVLKPLLVDCNIVASKNHQDRFFKTCNIKYSSTPIW